jgi:hypothetical protein
MFSLTTKEADVLAAILAKHYASQKPKATAAQKRKEQDLANVAIAENLMAKYLKKRG